MDTPQVSSHPIQSADRASMVLTLGYVLLQFFSGMTKNEISFWLAMAVGGTTLLYNGIKIYKEFKNKK